MSSGDSAAALYRRHPELFALADSVVDCACHRGNRMYAVWFDAGKWHSANPDGRYFAARRANAVLAGVYSCRANSYEIVLDMLAAQAEIMDAMGTVA